MAFTLDQQQEILDLVRSKSKGIQQLTTVSNLNGISSLPTLRNLNNKREVVLAPLSLLEKPALDAAKTAESAVKEADTARDNANYAAGLAHSARQTALEAARNAYDAAENANNLVENFHLTVTDISSILTIKDFVEEEIYLIAESAALDGEVIYSSYHKKIVWRVPNPGSIPAYYINWLTRTSYTNPDGSPRSDKGFLCNGSFYIWNGSEMIRQVNILDLIELEDELAHQNPFFNITERVPSNSGYYTLENAIQAVPADIRKKGLVITYQTENKKWETKQFTGQSLQAWSIEGDWKDFGKGGGGAVINVTTQFPLESGFYTLESAIEAIETAKEKAPGQILTFASDHDEWVTYQYKGLNTDSPDWHSLNLWQDVTSASTASVKEIGLFIPGEVNILDETSSISGQIVFLPDMKQIVCKVDNPSVTLYYRNWKGRTAYTDNTGTPHMDKVFMYNNSFYLWNGSQMIRQANTIDLSSLEKNLTCQAPFFNVTERVPLNSGYYTLEDALEAIPADLRKKGLQITFEVENGKWESYQFAGTDLSSFLLPSAWVESGGRGTVKTFSINANEKISPDAQGNVNINLEIPEVDETLDPESTNAIQNKTVTAKLTELETSTLFGSEVEVDEENNTVKVSLTNKSGAAITEFEIPAGSGSGSSEVAATRIILNASVDKETIKEGDSVLLSYSYDHQYTTGEEAGVSTGQKASVEITLKKGSTLVYSQTVQDISKGNYTLDISKYLTLGSTDIYVKVETTDPTTGNTQRKQAYKLVRVLNLSFSSSYSLANYISGYHPEDTLTVPFSVTGTGNKVVTLFVDGVQEDNRSVTRSGQTNGSFTLSLANLGNGRHTVQMVAELEAAEDLTIHSESVYFDILIKGNEEVQFIGSKITFPDGRIFDKDQHLLPRMDVKQYESLEFEFVAYDSTKNPTYVAIYRDGVKSQTISVARTTQVYTNRFPEEGEIQMKLVCEKTEYPLFIEVNPSDIDIEEVHTDLALRLLAAGRSNSEENPASWEYEETKTQFNGFDWNSNGWMGDVLRLTNGAAIDIDFKPFAADATATGASYEMELTCDNVIDRGGVVIDCMNNGVGFQLTTERASLTTNEGASVYTLFAPMPLKVAFVIENKQQDRYIHLYVNGIRCGIVKYSSSDSLRHASDPSTIRILSEACDVDIRAIRIYNRALTDNECLQNFIIDRPKAEDMILLVNNNDILNDEGAVDIDKIRAQGKSVMRVVGDISQLVLVNDKKKEVPVDLYYYSAFGKEYDFVAFQVGMRIQGTSSVNYPRKNWRLYFNRESKYEGCRLEVNGVIVPDFKYSFKPNARPIDIFCMKADYSDSSGVGNTGTARILGEVWKRANSLTPPQIAYNGVYDVRVSVDGFPCDMWVNQKAEGTEQDIEYIGKYNFNNEKSGSDIIYGFEGIDGFNDEATLNGQENPCICLEFLENTNPLNLFRINGENAETVFEEQFDGALEFRYPADVVWADANQGQKTAIIRLWEWIWECRNNPDKFRNEAPEYFNTTNLCFWYLYTDYYMAVDQRAKNMMLATWDRTHWYFLPYDGDTILGSRNDGKLRYDYTITEETFDEELQQYAFAGHDSILWSLVREGMQKELSAAAELFRSNMSNNYVLDILNTQQAGNWCETVYNKDSEYKYILPNKESDTAVLELLQGNRTAQRTFTVINHFALLDSQYAIGEYKADMFLTYMINNFSTDNRNIRVTASERFFFGYNDSNQTAEELKILAEGEGSTVTFHIHDDLSVSSPLRFFGASRMREIDLGDISDCIRNAINFTNCKVVEKINFKNSRGKINTSISDISVNGCYTLRELDVTGMKSISFTGMDLSTNKKLEKFVAADTLLTSVSFALGSLIKEITLPASLQVLELKNLSRLTDEGLLLENKKNINRIHIENTPGVDSLKLVEDVLKIQDNSLSVLRITDINGEGDGNLLTDIMNKGLKGINDNGAIQDKPVLKGKYHINKYISKEFLQVISDYFEGLEITRPDWTCIQYDIHVSDPANVTNLENKTGYLYGSTYQPSGHILDILNMRHRVLAKKTGKGECTYFPLHDENSNYYADAEDTYYATPADLLTGDEGEVFIYEPNWYGKGVNDYLGGRQLAYYSASDKKPPLTGDRIKIEFTSFRPQTGYALRISEDFATVEEAKAPLTGYYYIVVENISEYKMIRFPMVRSGAYGLLFTDDNKNIIARKNLLKMTDNLDPYSLQSDPYDINNHFLFTEIPEGVTRAYITLANNDFTDDIYLYTSNDPEIISDWCRFGNYLCGVPPVTIKNDIIKSVFTKTSPTNNLPPQDYQTYIGNKGNGFQMMDLLMYTELYNLHIAKYGNRNFRECVGYTLNGSTGYSAGIGMNDTHPINNTGSYYNDKNIGGTNDLGYENMFFSIWHLIIGNSYLNKYKVDYTLSIEGYDGTKRTIQLYRHNNSYVWSYFMRFGENMDIIRTSGSISGSNSTYYCSPQSNLYNATYNIYYMHRESGNPLNISYVTPTSFNTYRGTRLAFRGTIKKAESLTQYKSL
ncbi:MAG: hypothetical protein LIO93_06735 [Bacteroidales bacterium]|nr:hypothetical protein [Bacteroidales bacterium]